MRAWRGVPIVLLTLFAASGCLSTSSGRALRFKEGYKAPDIIAVLPPDNQSVDLSAPDTFRRAAAITLVSLGYFPMVSPAQDAALLAMGISDGGQLNAFKAQDVAARLGVDGLVYGKVEDFSDINLGVYRKRKVAGSLSLASPDGEKWWEARGQGVSQKVATSVDSVKASFIAGMAQALLEKALQIHLEGEAAMAANALQSKIPEWPQTADKKRERILKDIR